MYGLEDIQEEDYGLYGEEDDDLYVEVEEDDEFGLQELEGLDEEEYGEYGDEEPANNMNQSELEALAAMQEQMALGFDTITTKILEMNQ